MIVRGILKTLSDGAVRLFTASGRTGEEFSGRDLVQHYGFASRPKGGAEVLVQVDGNVVTCIGSDDRRYRLALEDGEAALYDDLGQKVHLSRKGIVLTSPLIVLDGYARTTNHLAVASGASGTFTDKTGKTVTVKNGIVVGIE